MNDHIIKDDNKPFHSNGYASAANGDRFGSTSCESFDRRRQVDANRRIVSGYQRSAIGGSYDTLVANRSIVRGNVNRINQHRTHESSMQQFNSGNQNPTLRPQGRRYNPYA